MTEEVTRIHGMTEREQDWEAWLSTPNVDTAGMCNCGNGNRGPSYHLAECPALGHIWHERARELHNQLWDLQETIAAAMDRWHAMPSNLQDGILERIEEAFDAETAQTAHVIEFRCPEHRDQH